MWFAQNATGSAELSSGQLSRLQNYKQLEGKLRATFTSAAANPLVLGIFTSYNLPGETICFHYPSYQETAFAQPTGSIISLPYERFLSQGKEMIVVGQPYESNFQPGTIGICTGLL
jgi:hypothetical protein